MKSEALFKENSRLITLYGILSPPIFPQFEKVGKATDPVAFFFLKIKIGEL